jgi:hypothetical protein
VPTSPIRWITSEETPGNRNSASETLKPARPDQIQGTRLRFCTATAPANRLFPSIFGVDLIEGCGHQIQSRAKVPHASPGGYPARPVVVGPRRDAGRRPTLRDRYRDARPCPNRRRGPSLSARAVTLNRHAGRLRVASSSAARSRIRSSSVIMCQRVARRSPVRRIRPAVSSSRRRLSI